MRSFEVSWGADLVFIQANFSFLPHAITSLEKAGLPLREALTVVSRVEEKINEIPEPAGIIFKTKMKIVLGENPNLETLRKVDKVIQLQMDELPHGMQPSDVANLKFAPIVSVDVERSFLQ